MSRSPCAPSAKSASEPAISPAASLRAVTITVAAIDHPATRRLSVASAAVEAGDSRLAFTYGHPIREPTRHVPRQGLRGKAAATKGTRNGISAYHGAGGRFGRRAGFL